MSEKFKDYSSEDLEILEEIESSSGSEKEQYSDYTESSLMNFSIVLMDLFEMISRKDWQVVARTKDSIVISEIANHTIDSFDQIDIIRIKSEYFFDVIDRQSRFTSKSLRTKVAKVANSRNYYYLAEEIEAEFLTMKGKY